MSEAYLNQIIRSTLKDQYSTVMAVFALLQSIFILQTCWNFSLQESAVCPLPSPDSPVSAATRHFSTCQNWQWRLWNASGPSDRNITDKVNSLQAKSCKKHLVTSQRCKKKSVKQLNIDGKLTMIASAVILPECIRRGIWHGQQCFMSILSDAEESCLFKQRYGGI